MMRSTIGAIVSLGLIFTLQQFDLFAASPMAGRTIRPTSRNTGPGTCPSGNTTSARGATISVIMIVFVMFASIVYVSRQT